MISSVKTINLPGQSLKSARNMCKFRAIVKYKNEKSPCSILVDSGAIFSCVNAEFLKTELKVHPDELTPNTDIAVNASNSLVTILGSIPMTVQFKAKEGKRKKLDTIQLQNIWFKVTPNISFDALLGFEVISFLQLI